MTALLSPSRVRRPAPNSLLDDMQASRRSQPRDEAAVWLRRCRAENPERFRQVARRHKVLSTWQITRRKAVEVSTEALQPGRDGTPQPVVSRQTFLDWQRVVETS